MAKWMVRRRRFFFKKRDVKKNSNERGRRS